MQVWFVKTVEAEEEKEKKNPEEEKKLQKHRRTSNRQSVEAVKIASLSSSPYSLLFEMKLKWLRVLSFPQNKSGPSRMKPKFAQVLTREAR